MTITCTVTNTGQNPAIGRWSDAVYSLAATTWSVTNPFVGRVQFTGTLLPGQSYTQTLHGIVPPLTPGAYHVIVRTDIFDEVYEGRSARQHQRFAGRRQPVGRAARLGRAFPDDAGHRPRAAVPGHVPAGQTLKMTATAGDARPPPSYSRPPASRRRPPYSTRPAAAPWRPQAAVVPTTQPGIYYILLDGFTMPNPGTPVTIEAELVPLSITDVQTDAGGDTGYVTTTITGAGFDPQAIVKLTRPGFAESSRSPIRWSMPPRSSPNST